jgi:GcrA cell cycle regulator
MQLGNWAPEHSEALREGVARGLSYSEIADTINAKFGTCYSRNATIGRGKRMGLSGLSRPNDGPKPLPRSKAPKLVKAGERKSRARRAVEAGEPQLPIKRSKSVKLRCVGVSPRLLSLIDLEDGDCHYPYGGDKDGEPIAFCGHPQLEGSCYCAPHFRLTRDEGTALARAAGPVALRLVEAA